MLDRNRQFRTQPKLRWLLWSAYVLLWTTALVVPVPGDAFDQWQVVRISLKVILAKSIHVFAYAVFAILTGWLLVPPRYRWALMYLLMFHACLTEIIQLTLVYRSGLLTDVLIDHIGIALGVAVTWRYWTAPGAEEAGNNSPQDDRATMNGAARASAPEPAPAKSFSDV